MVKRRRWRKEGDGERNDMEKRMRWRERKKMGKER